MNELAKLSADLEPSLLAAVMIDPNVLNVVCEITTGSEFLDDSLGKTFDLYADRYAAKLPVGDIRIMVPELRKAGLYDAIGNAAGIARIAATAGSAAGAEYHAHEIHRLFRIRQLSKLSIEIDHATSDPTADPEKLISLIESRTIEASASGSNLILTLSEAMEYLADQLDADRENGTVTGVPTGFDSVDMTTGGMFKGDSIVLAARTSIGKTACGMQIAMQAAVDGYSVLVLSLEMKELQLAQRIAAGKLGLSLVDQRSGNHTAEDSRRIREFASQSRHTRLSIFPARRATVARIAGVARSVKSTGGLDLMVVDYMQLISPRDRRVHRTEQVTEISNELKTLAIELDIPIVSLAQLNRQGEDDRPKLSHLRESGAIEQDADMVWFLHRGRDSADTEFIIEKNRQGPTGKVDMRFDKDKCEFFETPIEPHANYHDEFHEWAS